MNDIKKFPASISGHIDGMRRHEEIIKLKQCIAELERELKDARAPYAMEQNNEWMRLFGILWYSEEYHKKRIAELERRLQGERDAADWAKAKREAAEGKLTAAREAWATWKNSDLGSEFETNAENALNAALATEDKP